MKYNITFELELKRNPGPGKYYAVEGIDGSGKTTQAQLLVEYFRTQGKDVVLTKEPTNGEIGKLIYRVLHKEITMPAISLQYLFCADRAEHLASVVVPALQAGKTVISDRSLWSAVAYGIVDQQIPENEKERLLVAYNAVLALYGGFVIPDTTFLLDIPYETALARTSKRTNTIESIYDKSEKLQRIEEEYDRLAEKFKEVFVRIDGDGDQTPQQVHEKIVDHFIEK